MKKRSSYKPRNWSEYNKAKINSGNIFIYFKDDIKDWWYNTEKNGKKGRNNLYSNHSIELALIVHYLFKIPLRQTQGFIAGMFEKFGLNLNAQNYSTISRRSQDLDVLYRTLDPTDNLHIVVDSSGVQIHSGNQWNAYKHRVTDKQKWLKVHCCVHAQTGEVLSNTLTDSCTSDSSQVKPLLDELPDKIEKFYGDGAYDRHQTYDAIAEHQSSVVDTIIPPLESSKTPEDPEIELTQREKHVEYIQNKGRLRWNNKHNYGQRQKAEGVFAKFKALFDEKLLSRDSCAQQTELNLKCKWLNQMNKLYTSGFAR